MSKIVIGSPYDKKGITISPSKIMFNANNVKKMMKNDVIIWISEVKALIPVMTSSTTPSGVVKADSGTGSAAYYAFDDDESTRWASSTGAGSWLEYCFETKKFATKFYIKAGYSLNSSGVKSFKIQGSNDETQWIDLTDEITLPNTSGGAEYTGELKNTSNYKYYRFYATTNSHYDGDWVSIAKLQLYGF